MTIYNKGVGFVSEVDLCLKNKMGIRVMIKIFFYIYIGIGM